MPDESEKEVNLLTKNSLFLIQLPSVLLTVKPLFIRCALLLSLK
jgi:hypothetical protein